MAVGTWKGVLTMTVRQFPISRWQTILAVAISLALTMTLIQAAHAQTYTVLHTFTGGVDGATPYGGLTWDGGANFYGTAAQGGYTGTRCYNIFLAPANGCGTVFRLHRSGSSWTFSTLYEFRGGSVDGNFPTASVTIAADGSLYGTTFAGDDNGQLGCNVGLQDIGCGTVFNLRPPANACTTALCSWKESIIYAFGTTEGAGSGPGLGQLVFDQAGNLYGTNWNAPGNVGTVFQLVPSGGSWMLGETYSGIGGPTYIFNGVTFDSAGNLYGASQRGLQYGPYCAGGRGVNGCGTVFQLIPTDSGWNADILYTFTGGEDGKFPTAGLVADREGNLYGATSAGGAGSGGVVFELSPSGGSWTYNLIYSLPNGDPQQFCFQPIGDGGCSGPWGTLLMDSAGNLYGASFANGAYQYGNVFELTLSNGSWTYTDLYDFTGGNDGANPIGPLILDGDGNIFGTTANGGADGYGVVFEITP